MSNYDNYKPCYIVNALNLYIIPMYWNQSIHVVKSD